MKRSYHVPVPVLLVGPVHLINASHLRSVCSPSTNVCSYQKYSSPTTVLKYRNPLRLGPPMQQGDPWPVVSVLKPFHKRPGFSVRVDPDVRRSPEFEVDYHHGQTMTSKVPFPRNLSPRQVCL